MKLVVIFAILLTAGLVLVGAALIAAIGSEDTTSTVPGAPTSPAQTEASPAASTAPTTQKPEPEPEPEPSQPTVKMGQNVRDDAYQFRVTKVSCGVTRVGNEKAQGQFCLVKLRVKNVGDEPIHVTEENQALLDTKGREYSPDDEAWIYLDSDPWAEINPGNSMTTTVPFDIPRKAKPDYLRLAGFWGFSDGVKVSLR